MKSNPTIKLALFALIAILFTGGVIYTVLNSNFPEHSPSDSPSDNKETQEKAQEDFLKKIKSTLPENFIEQSIWGYLDPKIPEPISALEFSPCEKSDSQNPKLNPKCHSTLTVWRSSGNYKDIYALRNNNTFWNWYEKALDTEIKYGEDSRSIPFAFTQTPFPCPDDSRETCMRKQFAFLLPDGTAMQAEIKYWPFSNGKYADPAPDEIAQVLAIYENALMN